MEGPCVPRSVHIHRLWSVRMLPLDSSTETVWSGLETQVLYCVHGVLVVCVCVCTVYIQVHVHVQTDSMHGWSMYSVPCTEYLSVLFGGGGGRGGERALLACLSARFLPTCLLSYLELDQTNQDRSMLCKTGKQLDFRLIEGLIFQRAESQPANQPIYQP